MLGSLSLTICCRCLLREAIYQCHPCTLLHTASSAAFHTSFPHSTLWSLVFQAQKQPLSGPQQCVLIETIPIIQSACVWSRKGTEFISFPDKTNSKLRKSHNSFSSPSPPPLYTPLQLIAYKQRTQVFTSAELTPGGYRHLGCFVSCYT